MNKEPCEMSGPSRSLRVVSGTVARLALSALLAGCASRLSSIHRIARYQPEISVEEREPWERDLPETDDVAAEPVGEETAEPGNVAADPEPATGVDMSLARKWTSVSAFQYLWDTINGKKYPWKDNRWVWVLTLKTPEL